MRKICPVCLHPFPVRPAHYFMKEVLYHHWIPEDTSELSLRELISLKPMEYCPGSGQESENFENES